MERYLRKSAGNGLERGFGPAAMIEPAASAAVRDPQRAEDPQPLLYTPHWTYEQTDGEGQNGNSGVMDEPTAGVDPQSREQILNLVRRLRDDGNAILYTTHYMEEAEGLCDRLCILHKGKLVTVGTLDELLHSLDFSEVIELKGLSAQTDLTAIRTLPKLCHIECGQGLVRLFVKRAADHLELLQNIISRDRSARLRIAPISLENLFLY